MLAYVFQSLLFSTLKLIHLHRKAYSYLDVSLISPLIYTIIHSTKVSHAFPSHEPRNTLHICILKIRHSKAISSFMIDYNSHWPSASANRTSVSNQAADSRKKEHMIWEKNKQDASMCWLQTSVSSCVVPWQTSIIRLLVFLPPELPAATGEFGVCINISIEFKGQYNMSVNLCLSDTP